jgi:hypothetical protein
MAKRQKWWKRRSKITQKRKEMKGNTMSKDKTTPIAVGKELSEDEFAEIMEAHNQGGAFKQASAVRQTCWDAGIEILSNCGKMTVPQYHIEFSLAAHQKITCLKKSYPSLEWLAYLVGVVNHDEHKVTVEDLVLPDSQQVTGASVYNVEYTWPVLPDGKNICGVIHSHHSMGAFFSGTDDAYINQNHDVSIVVATAKGREIKSQVRIKTPCDAYVLAEDITYSVKYPQVLDEEAFEAEFKAKISSYTPVIPYTGGYDYMGNFLRGYSGHQGISNVYGGRSMGNPPRGGQMDLYEGYDDNFDPWGDIDDEFDNPYMMSSDELKDALLDYYSMAEATEFMDDGFNVAANELKMVQDLCSQGINVGLGSLADVDWETDEDNITDQNDHAQLGRDRVIARGVPLSDQGKTDDDVWSTGDEIDVKDPLYQRLNAQLEAEGLFIGLTVVERDTIIREAIGETQDMIANGR